MGLKEGRVGSWNCGKGEIKSDQNGIESLTFKTSNTSAGMW